MNSSTPMVARRRILIAVFAAFVTLSPLSIWTPDVHADRTALDSGFEGRVRDSFGNALAGVEILFISTLDPLATSPAASVRSDAEGRFKLSSLRRGSYQVAAIKSGYRTLLAQVHTDSGRWLPMILMPEQAALEQGVPLPQDRRWGLRLPRRHLLRETEATVATALPQIESSFDAVEPSAPPASDLQIRVDQFVQVMTDLRRLPDEEPVLQGVDTRLQLNGAIGPRAELQAQAQRQRLSSSKYLGRNGATTSRSQDRLAASLDYELSAVSDLDAELQFMRRSARWSPRELAGAQALDHDGEAWQARLLFDRLVGGASTWSSEFQAHSNQLELLNGPDGAATLEQHGWTVQNRFTTQRTARHRMQWGLDWSQLETKDPQRRRLRATPLDGAASPILRDGAEVALVAQHSLQLDSSWTLLYGGQLRQSLGNGPPATAGDGLMAAPEIGVRWTAREFALQCVAAYVDAAEASQLGYRAQLEWLIDPMTELQFEWIDEPTMRTETGRAQSGRTSASLPYVTNGDVARSQARATLRGRMPALDWFAEVDLGRLDGDVAAVMPYDLPFQTLSQRQLDYLGGRFGLNLPPSGTTVSIALRHVSEMRDGMDRDLGATHRSVEFSLAQRLLQRDELGQWRFLLALSLARLAADDLDALRQVVSSAPLESTDGRLTAGVSLEF